MAEQTTEAEKAKTEEDKVERYQYPLTSQEDYKARIEFQLVEEVEITPEDFRKLFGYALPPKLIDAVTGVESPATSADTSEERARTNEEFEGGSRATTAAKTRTVPKTIVSLYMPQALQFRDTAQYENFDLGATGGLIEGGLQRGIGAAKSISGGISSFINSMKPNDANVSDLAKLGAIQLAAAKPLLKTERLGAARSVLGATLNPNTRVFFKQVGIRDFSFTFKMIGRSKQEVDQINKIVRFFRTELYPESIDISDVSVGYKFPHKFNISFLYDGRVMEQAPKLKPCFLRDVSTTYNASGMSMHSDGQFLEVDLTLSFQENRALSKQDIKEGY
jgi:hypothetical protein